MLWMAVVSQSSVKSSRQNSASSSVGSKPFSSKSSLKSQPLLCTAVDTRFCKAKVCLVSRIINEASFDHAVTHWHAY